MGENTFTSHQVDGDTGDDDAESTVTIEGITLSESDAEAFVDGMIFGDRGLSDGDDPQETASSPFYALGQLAIGFVPGLGDVADIRDAHQQVKNDKLGEAAVSALASIPVIGSYFDGPKATNFAKTWLNRFPTKGDDIASLLAKHVAPHMPDKLTVDLIDIFTDGKASTLKDNGKSVDEIIERAKNGKLDENPNKEKKIATDGGRSPDKVKQTIGNGRYVDDDLTDANYRHIEEHGTPDETLVAIKPDKSRSGNGQAVWLEKGSNDGGWKHVKNRHIKGELKVDEKDITSIFPMGQSVKGKTMPNRISEAELQNMIYDSVKKGEGESAMYNNIEYTFNPTKNGYPNSGIEEMTVRVNEDGKVISAFPEEGPAVNKWIPGLNNGKGGFLND